MADLQSLLDRVRAASGADFALDWEITVAVTPGARPCSLGGPAYEIEGQEHRVFVARPITASIDSALALTERVLPGWDVSMYVHRTKHTKVELNRWQDLAPEFAFACSSGEAATPALAICAALIRALISKRGREGG